MKILTKPEQFRMASPSIYGYEGSWSFMSSYVEDCWLYKEYECFEDTVFICVPGETKTERKWVGHQD
ncbi:MAG: hypothetical protein J4F29_24355 [Candidatus Latescibacteria bacterium]|nr:hypothetical protein [Candidatus Latescibacterota bacterium]